MKSVSPLPAKQGLCNGSAKMLENPELYTTREGAQKSQGVGKELEATKRKLDVAFASWTDATERAEQLSAI